MFTEERYRIIIEKLDKNGLVSVNDLVKLLNASESTVRRDLNFLESEGALRKIHGGAISINKNLSKYDYEVHLRKNFNMEEKRKVASYAASLINENDIVYLDSGTTTELLIDYIENRNIIVVTNGIVHAKKLIENGIKTFILGGEVKHTTEAIIGSNAIEYIKKYNFSKGFFGTNGISKKSGYTTPDIHEAMVKEKAIEQCEEAYILCDESKIDQVSFVTFANIDECTIIINDGIEENYYETNIINLSSYNYEK